MEDWEKYTVNGVPQRLFRPSKKQGVLKKIAYRSFDVSEEEEIYRKAVIYTPYGYDEDVKRHYDILYLMHGSGGDETTFFGTEDKPEMLKTMIDNMISEGLIKPLIVVMPALLSTEIGESRQNALTFPEVYVNDLIPAVEKNYRTYAHTTDRKGITESRCHRAFGGFSLGSVAAWAVFSEALYSTAYFLPLCGDCWEKKAFGGRECPAQTADFLSSAAKRSGFGPDDFFIYSATGTDDSAYEMLPPMVGEMKKHRDIFRYTEDDFDKGNLILYEKKDSKHSYRYSYEYIYRALPLFFTK